MRAIPAAALAAFLFALATAARPDPAPAGDDGGAAVTAPTDVQTKLNLATHVRESAHFRIETLLDEAATQELVRLAERTYAELFALAGFPADRRVFKKKMDILLLESQDQFVAWLKDVSGLAPDVQAEWAKTHARLNNRDVHWVAWQGKGSKDWPREVVVHHTAHLLTQQITGVGGNKIPGWVYESLANHLSLKLVDRVETYCVSPDKETAPITAAKKATKGASAVWKKSIKTLVQQKKDPDMTAVLVSGLDRLQGDLLVKSWSVVDFLATNKGKELAALLSENWNSQKQEAISPERVQNHLGAFADLQKEWAEWVKKTY